MGAVTPDGAHHNNALPEGIIRECTIMMRLDLYWCVDPGFVGCCDGASAESASAASAVNRGFCRVSDNRLGWHGSCKFAVAPENSHNPASLAPATDLAGGVY